MRQNLKNSIFLYLNQIRLLKIIIPHTLHCYSKNAVLILLTAYYLLLKLFDDCKAFMNCLRGLREVAKATTSYPLRV